ncbi:hypothetical protein GQ457_13G009140 [Hibiscus cannabinus]
MSLFEVIHMIESLGIENTMKVFRTVPNGPFKVLNMVAELPRNRNVHLYLVEQDHAFVSESNDEHDPVGTDSEFGNEPNIETNVESRNYPNDESIGRDTESGSEPNVETNVESKTDPNEELVGSDTESGSKPNVETNAQFGTDPNDEPVGNENEFEIECESALKMMIFLLIKRLIVKLNQ